MSLDLGPILEGWDENPNSGLAVRMIEGLDGRPKIQLRIEMGLGVMQMELTGRPDGLRPFGYESLLDYYQAKLEEHRRRYGSDQDFVLDRRDCAALQAESMQYYYRRLSCLELGEYVQAIRDADHNLAILDLLKDYAAHREDWLASEQYRAFILSHRVKAQALACLQQNDVAGALQCIAEGIAAIEEIFEGYGRRDLSEESVEIAFLKNLRQAIQGHRPPTLRERLEQELQEAIAAEQFERAAELRDQLRRLQQT
jgi:hypothetical protein